MSQDREYDEVLESMRRKAAEVFGITLGDDRVTLRWTYKGKLVSVSMIVDEVVTPTLAAEEIRRMDEFKAVIKKYEKVAPNLEAELYHAEHGEWPE